MEYKEIVATDDDIELLVKIRLEAMQESLEAVGRFDPKRARARFLDTFDANSTMKIVIDDVMIGLYVVRKYSDHVLLDHLYITPDFQSKGIGSSILRKIKRNVEPYKLPLRLGALRNSRSNDFYKNNGFIQTHQSEWDNYYEIQFG